MTDRVRPTAVVDVLLLLLLRGVDGGWRLLTLAVIQQHPIGARETVREGCVQGGQSARPERAALATLATLAATAHVRCCAKYYS